MNFEKKTSVGESDGKVPRFGEMINGRKPRNQVDTRI